VPSLFGSNEKIVTSAISRDSGLSSGAISTLLTMAAPVVMSFISKQMRDGGMTMSGLGSMLQRETASIRSALPSGISELFWPGTATTAATATASPVVAQAVQRETSFNWLPVLAIAGLGLGLLWFLGHARRSSIEQVVPSVAVGTASRAAVPVPVCTLPANVNLPQGGTAARLLSFAQHPTQGPSNWVNMDQMSFDTGSARLRPQSQAQLDNIAVVLKSCPAVHLDIAGYTDNIGPAEANLRLSQNRARAVVAQLAAKGVSPERLAAEGYGEEDAIADNSTEQGRAQNRRAALRVVTVK
jgi:outer membrane protein OmpA-like peptidoglycan-associated protein